MTELFVHGVFSLFALICLAGLFFTAWQSLVVDTARQRMFEVRDRTFLWAYDHGRLEDPAYREFRDVANVAIRHFETMSVFKLMVFGRLVPNLPSEFSFLKDQHLKKEFNALTEISAFGLIARSALVWIGCVLLLPIAALLALFRGSTDTKRVATHISRNVSNDILLAASM